MAAYKKTIVNQLTLNKHRDLISIKFDHLIQFLLIYILVALVPFNVYAEQNLKVGVYKLQPLVFVDEQNNASGLFVDVLNVIAKEEGWNIEYVSGSFPEGVSRLDSGKIDILTCIAPTEMRLKQFDFTQQHVFLDWGIVYRPKGGNIETIFDLTGKKVGILAATVYVTDFKKLVDQFDIRNVTLVEGSEYKELFTMLSTGKIDALISNNLMGLQLESSYPTVERTTIQFSANKIRYAVKKGYNSEILAKLDSRLQSLYADKNSVYYDLFRKWTGVSSKPGQLPTWILWSLIGLISLVTLLVAISMFFKRQVAKKTADLRSSEARLQTLMHTIPDLVWLKDSQGVYLSCNHRFECLFNASEKDIVGKTDYDFVPKDLADSFRKYDIAAISKQDATINEEWVTFANDGHRELLETTKVPFYDASNKLIGVLGIGHDITERKQAEQELHTYRDQLEQKVEERTKALTEATNQAKMANQAKSVFLANMSHELRTPLNAVLGFSQLLQRETALSEEGRRNLGTINQSGQHLLTIINDILDLAKIDSGKISLESQPFDLGELTNDLMIMLKVRADAKGLNLILDQSSSFPRYIKSDAAKLRQILINLIGNAIKFTQKGGVTIKLYANSEKNANQHPQISFEISDTGTGIAVEDIERVFEPFIQLGSHEGTGLGLTITRQFVKLLGGNLSLKSTLGEGSTFSFTINYEPVEESNIPSHAIPQSISSISNAADFKILIVEDHAENRLFIRSLLKPMGFQIMEVDNGRDSVDIFTNWKPDCILMDRRMPILDGLEATKEIRKLPDSSNTVIIAVTAHAFKDEQTEMFDAGCNGFIAKPFRAEELFDVLGKLLPLKIIYIDDKTSAAKAIDKTVPKDLKCIPHELQLRLIKALDASKMRDIENCISEVSNIDSSIGEWISYEAQHYEYDKIAKLFKELGGDQ